MIALKHFSANGSSDDIIKNHVKSMTSNVRYVMWSTDDEWAFRSMWEAFMNELAVELKEIITHIHHI